MNFQVHPRQVLAGLLYLILGLLLLNVLGIVSEFYLDHDYVHGLVPLFRFEREANVPTLYSSIALLFSSALLLIIAKKNRRIGSAYFPWLGLAVIFLFISIDEIASIHERLIAPVRESLGTSGLLFFAWIIPYGVALLVFVIAYSRFLFRLPKKISALFVISGAIFVSGAIGFEMLGGWRFEMYGNHDLVYSLYYTCEETLEMVGIAIFIYALLTHIVRQFGSLTVVVNERI